MRGVLSLAVLLTTACIPAAVTPPAPPTNAVGRAGGSKKPAVVDERQLGEYDVTYDGRGSLRVEAVLRDAGQHFSVESGAERFLFDFEMTKDIDAPKKKWVKGARSNRSFVASLCATGGCRIRYRYALRDASKAIDDLDVASEEGEVVEAPPSTWLLAPTSPAATTRIRFRVATPLGTTFVTGVYSSPIESGAWDIALGDLWTSPYSAFGPFRTRILEVAGSRILIAFAPGKLTVTDEEMIAWAESSANAIVTYFGKFPIPHALVMLIPARGRWVGEGKTLSGGGGSIFMRVGERANVRSLKDDWVLVHEMTHLAFPSVAREHDWAEEGLATYVEPFARARAGTMTAEDAWKGLVEGLPNGLPGPGDQGLDRTPTWGRTYWGGALFYLLADIEIRKQTKNRYGLEHALRGILAAGGDNAHRWQLEDAFATGDKAIGVTVLRDLHAQMGSAPHPVDLDALAKDLGVFRDKTTVRFDDAAPLAGIRRAIVTP